MDNQKGSTAPKIEVRYKRVVPDPQTAKPAGAPLRRRERAST